MFGIFRYTLALLVAFGHVHPFFQGIWNWTGLYAVFGFFVLSGYLMTRVLHRTYGYSRFGFLAYIENRALRIYPAYWAALALSILWLLLAPESPGSTNVLVRLPSSVHEYFRSIVLVGIHRDFMPRVVPPSWSLHIELCFYVLIGLGLSRTAWTTAIWLAAAMLWTAWASYNGVSFADRYSTLLAASLPFAVGSSLHYLQRQVPRWVLAGAIVLACLNIFLAPVLWGDPKGFVAFYLSLLLVAVIVAGLRDIKFPAGLARWDRRLGDLSYPIFLLHSQIGYLVGWLGWAQPATLQHFLVSLPVMHVVAVALHLSVVAPVERLRARVRARASAEATRTRRRIQLGPRTAAAVTVGVSVLIAGLVGEGLLRVKASMSASRNPAPLPPELVGLPSIEGLFALAKPNQRVNYRGALYTTNSRGTRGPEIQMPKPPGTFRIVVIGDSITMGSGVRYEEAYPELMEHGLGPTKDGRHVEVINLGLAGANLAGEVDNRLPIALEGADMIVYGWTVNDIEGPYYRTLLTAGPPGPSLLINLVRDRIRYLRDIYWPASDSYIGELDENYFRNPKQREYFEQSMDRLAAIGRSRNICVVVLIHPQMSVFSDRHPYFRYYDLATEAARRRGMFVVQGFPPFLNRNPEDYRCHPMDWHPNAKAHVLLAQVLIDEMLRLPAECWKGVSATQP